MKVLLSCGNNLGQPTGYGGQSLIIARHLRRAGHEVICIAWSNVHPEAKLRKKMIPFLQTAEKMGRESLLTAEDRVLFEKDTWGMVNPIGKWPANVPKALVNEIVCMTQADMMIAFQDIFVFEDGPVLVPTLVWMPFHFKPMEQRVVRALGAFDVHVAMTRYGEMLCNDYFGPCCPAAESSAGQAVKQIEYIPHGRPRDVFCPPSRPVADLRTELGFGWPQDAFVCLIVASNSEGSNRKAFDAQLQAWSRFASHMEHSGRKAWLHIHSKMDGAMDLLRVLEMLGEVEDRTRWTDPRDTCGKSKVTDLNDVKQVGRRVTCSLKSSLHKTSNEDMARMYQAADVFMACACAEGFGVPIIEAQLCGCPVVTNKTTSMTELTRIGYTVFPAQWISRNDFNAGWDLPCARRVLSALRRVAGWTPEERRRKIEEGLREVVAEYDTAPVGEAWVRVLEDLYSRIGEDGRVRGFPEKRNTQLAAGQRIRGTFREEVELGPDIRVALEEVSILDARERRADLWAAMC